jgi:hypothetical protein
MKSKGATIRSARRTFLSGTACRFSTFAKQATRASLVLQKNIQKFCQKKITPMKLNSINPQKIPHYDGRKMDFPEITNSIIFSKQSKNMI